MRRRLPGTAVRAGARPYRSCHRHAGGIARRPFVATLPRPLRRRRRRVAAARRPARPYHRAGNGRAAPVRTNAEADGALLDRVADPDAGGRRLLTEAVERMRLSARSYHRVLRVARSLADLDGATAVARIHIAEGPFPTVGLRRPHPNTEAPLASPSLELPPRRLVARSWARPRTSRARLTQ
ncbi:MAG: hypothetical protein U1E33_06245 [Rhodospirillales bacterium]